MIYSYLEYIKNSQNSTLKKPNTPTRQWASHEETFHQRGYTDGNEHVKKCSTSLTIREMKIKPRISYRHTTIRTAKIKIVTVPNANKDVEKLDPSYIAGGNTK